MDNGFSIKIVIINFGYMIFKINLKNKFYINWWLLNIDEFVV